VLGSDGKVEVLQVHDLQPEGIKGLDVIVVGSPAQQFKPSGATSSFLKRIPKKSLRGASVTALDTRLTVEKIEETTVLAFFIRIFGGADKPFGDALKKKGGDLVLPLEGFLVERIKGPLVEGELERAQTWSKKIVETLSPS